jgi:hypothetical protein
MSEGLFWEKGKSLVDFADYTDDAGLAEFVWHCAFYLD